MEEVEGKSCPMNGRRINETVVRLVAGQVAVLITISVLTCFYWLTAFVLLDFTLRAFAGGKGSILKFLAKWIAETFKLSRKPTDEAPKLFAAKIGFITVLLLFGFQVLELNLGSLIVASGLILFAILESVFAVCVGCMLYQWLYRFQTKLEL